VARAHKSNGRHRKPPFDIRRNYCCGERIVEPIKQKTMKNKNIWELILKVIVAAITAALTAITTTSCMGLGPI
jgi:hypothetical protein